MERLTKIVCTLGPSSSTVEIIADMAQSGMDFARLNFSHGNHDEHLSRINMVRSASKSIGKRILLLQDLPGPKLRIGILADPIVLEEGSSVTLSTSGAKGTLPITKNLLELIGGDASVLISDGKIQLKVESISESGAVCAVLRGGIVSSGKGVNIVGGHANGSAVTEEDIRHIKFGHMNNVDCIAVSFVRAASDIERAKSILNGLGRNTPVIAKIEKPEAVENIKEIVEVSDAVMVARGDLGVEMGIERVPFAQKTIITEANRQMKPVITATQMLASMVGSKVPTRAEVSDVVNSMLDGTDAVMTSEETAVGKNPVNVVGLLAMLLKSAEASDAKIMRRLESRRGESYRLFLGGQAKSIGGIATDSVN